MSLGQLNRLSFEEFLSIGGFNGKGTKKMFSACWLSSFTSNEKYSSHFLLAFHLKYQRSLNTIENTESLYSLLFDTKTWNRTKFNDLAKDIRIYAIASSGRALLRNSRSRRINLNRSTKNNRTHYLRTWQRRTQLTYSTAAMSWRSSLGKAAMLWWRGVLGVATAFPSQWRLVR